MPPSSEQILDFLQGIQRLLVLVGQKKALGIAVHNDRPQRRYSELLSRLRFVSYQKSCSGFFQQSRNPDQNYRAHKRDNDGTYHAASRQYFRSGLEEILTLKRRQGGQAWDSSLGLWVGLIAGWLAGQVMKGGGYGVL